MKALCCFVIISSVVWTARCEEHEDGEWGRWIKISRCSGCKGIRYKYNCTKNDPRISKTAWNPNGICDAGMYYDKINQISNGCFTKKLNVRNGHQLKILASNQTNMEIMEYQLKKQGLWEKGKSRWTRCSRRAGRRKGSIYNRRGRRVKPFYCPTDNRTIWREQWGYCCAGVWSRWQRITECPECGSGSRKYVRICGIPGVPLDVGRLSLNGEFMSEWKQEACKPTPCARAEEKMKTCLNLCGDGTWEETTKCRSDEEVLQARECCMRGYRGIQPSCGPLREREQNPHKQQGKIVMVAIILGAEGLLIAVTAVIIILYNIGKFPNIVTRLIASCCCNKPTATEPSPPTTSRWHDIVKYQPTKGKQVVLLNKETQRSHSNQQTNCEGY